MENRLYPDFTPTLENCDREPIHRPGAIQGHGLLLAIDRQSERPVAAGRNIEELTGRRLEECWDMPLSEWLPAEVLAVLEEAGGEEYWTAINPVRVSIDGKAFDLIGHPSSDVTVLELEPIDAADEQELHTYAELRRIENGLKLCNSVEEVAGQMARQLKGLTGYDRVMVYRFNEDWHGEVIGEAKEEGLEPFLGLHYPATDIPLPARNLFLLNGTRIIKDIHLQNSPLEINPSFAGRPPLDLSHAQLRATSPIHIEYLRNMGVHATFTVAIVVNGKLWGLFAHHHYGGDRFIPYELRKMCEILSTLCSRYLVQLELAAYEEQSRDFRRLEELLFKNIIGESVEKMREGLMEGEPNLLDLSPASGVALVLENGIWLKGETPDKEEIGTIRDRLQQHEGIEVYETQSLIEDLNLPEEFAPETAGLLGVCISELPTMFIFWFKPPVSQTVNWGGNPHKAVAVEGREDAEGIRLSPRKSFAKWKEVVKHKSLPWQTFEIDMAWRVREKLLRMELKRIGNEVVEKNRKLGILNSELEQLVYIASHDLQEPLKTITSYVDLIEEEGEEVLNEDLRFYMSRVVRSTQRMKTLIKDLLDYSRIGRSEETQEVELGRLVGEIVEDMETAIRESEGSVNVSDLPTLRGNPVELKRLFQNLISNALKFRKPGRPVAVSITAEPWEEEWKFAVSDNGIGMEAENLERIFLLFQRLHNREEYEGTGIGLAQCKKIVEVYGGDIWVASAPGEGTTFYFTLTEQKIYGV